MKLERQMSFARIALEIHRIGDDYCVLLSGGERPHIGCSVMSLPRTSLTGDAAISATSSVMNLPGHKDEAICRLAAETIASKKNATVVCLGGFHNDNIKGEQIAEVIDTVKQLVCEI